MSDVALNAVEVIRAAIYRPSDRKQIRIWNDRIYLEKGHGYLIVASDGSIDTTYVTGIAESKAVASILRAAGFNVPVRKIAGGGKI